MLRLTPIDINCAARHDNITRLAFARATHGGKDKPQGKAAAASIQHALHAVASPSSLNAST